jgi:hypothetical protein
MENKKKDYSFLAVKMDIKTANKLRKYLKEEDRTVSGFIRILIKNYLKTKESENVRL